MRERFLQKNNGRSFPGKTGFYNSLQSRPGILFTLKIYRLNRIYARQTVHSRKN
jgi:hypothetical protein